MFLFIIGFICGAGLALLHHKIQTKKIYGQLSEYSNSILSLNISHLHDAANLFDLQKNLIRNQNYKSIQGLETFNRGAAYHFRSIFDELKTNILQLNKIKDIQNLEIYSKENLDLKDLLELEIFQISSLDQIKIKDLSKSNSAMVFGNFQLLSKAILNLIENSLKYSDSMSTLELLDSGSFWEIKITSKGNPLPNDVLVNLNKVKLFSSPLNFLNTKSTEKQMGHGLSSLINIIQFHNGSIDTISIDSGNIIKIYLPKSMHPSKSELDTCFLNTDSKAFRKRELNQEHLLRTCIVISTILILGILSYYSLKCITPNPKPKETKLLQPLQKVTQETTTPIKSNDKHEKKTINNSELDRLIDQKNQELNLKLEL